MSDMLFLLVPVLIFWSWLLPIGFTSRRVEGAVLCTIPIPMLSRLKRHLLPNVVTLGTAVVLAMLGIASSWWIPAALFSGVGLVAMPQSYILTTRGIRTGNGNFRRWTEFAGVHRSAAGATLQTIRRGPGMPIWLSGSREDDEFVHLLRGLIRDSYKGKLAPVTADPPAMPAQLPNELSAIATFTREG